MILEGIVTTVNEDGSPNIAPMGPIVDVGVTRLTLRPFQTSSTYRNLKRTGEGIFHVTDDVELLARAAVNRIELPPLTKPSNDVYGFILSEACRWYAFRVGELNDTAERKVIECEVVATGRLRDFFGFNRAKHAVVEGAILATRIGIISPADIRADFQRLSVIVEKTAGDQERRAFAFLTAYIHEQLDSPQSTDG